MCSRPRGRGQIPPHLENVNLRHHIFHDRATWAWAWGRRGGGGEKKLPILPTKEACTYEIRMTLLMFEINQVLLSKEKTHRYKRQRYLKSISREPSGP